MADFEPYATVECHECGDEVDMDDLDEGVCPACRRAEARDDAEAERFDND